MKRRTLLIVVVLALVVVGLGTWALTHRNTSKPTVAILNLLSHPILDQSVQGIKDGLQDRGYSPERVRIIEVNANGEMDKLDALAREMLAVNPDVIVPVSTPMSQAVVRAASAKQAIVFSTVTNPADIGIRAGATNVTGVSDVVNYAANLDLLKELFPGARRIGIIYNAGERNSQYGVDRVRQLAAERGLDLRLVTVSRSDQVVDATRSLIGQVDAIYVGSDNTVVSAIAGVTRVAYENHIPVIASDIGSVEDGALAAVSVDYRKLGRTAGEMVAQLLSSGESPGEIRPVAFQGDALVLNDQAAERLGFTFPAGVRSRAAKVVGP
ncbi:MAG: ABC transporter substrate-binding protein [Longimicrobiaceae bacterium]